jgi:hypothetical protein
MNFLLLPVKLLGWTAVGLAAGVGWKLGCYLVDSIRSSEDPGTCCGVEDVSDSDSKPEEKRIIPIN